MCKLREMISANNYPISFFNKTLYELENNSNSNNKESSENFVLLKIAFVGSPSFEFSKKIYRPCLKNSINLLKLYLLHL